MEIKELEFRVLENLYLLEKEVRDCALIECDKADENDNVREDIEEIILKRLSSHPDIHVVFKTFRCDNETYVNAFLYKYNYQRILIEKLYTDIPCHSFLYEYCLGTLLGYSNASMEKFLMRQAIDKVIDAKNNDRCNQCSAE